jgi:hypothetical protein
MGTSVKLVHGFVSGGEQTVTLFDNDELVIGRNAGK